ncbi:hypothetical protein T261_8529 [Streptomyces lydicus]|nr:hypothetical protein T261_8529 [Streptomyces lydicus]
MCRLHVRGTLTVRTQSPHLPATDTSFSSRGYRVLLIAAHQQLGGPIVLLWDSLNVHKAAGLREFAVSRDWPVPQRPHRPAASPRTGLAWHEHA